MKKFFRSIHLYLSLAAGLVILISCLTGAILVFEHEITSSLHSERFLVADTGEKLPLYILTANAQRQLPGSKVASVKISTDPTKTIEVSLTLAEKKNRTLFESKNTQKEKQNVNPEAGISREINSGPNDGKEKNSTKGQRKKEERKPTVTAYVNPYSGKVIEVFDKRKSFFFTVEMLHRWLLTGKEGVGKTIVGISTFMFLFILITGLVLWWPKTKKLFKQRTSYNLTDGWRRLNHDLHIVTGFYLSIFLIVIVISGLVMSYNWMNKGLFALTGSSMENTKAPISDTKSQRVAVSLDQVYITMLKQLPDAAYYNIRLPQDSASVYTVNTLKQGIRDPQSSTYFFDQYSGISLGVQHFEDKNPGQKMRAYVKPIHTGAVFGWPTKLLSLIICLLTLSFPITGVIMWLSRKGVIKKGTLTNTGAKSTIGKKMVS